MVVNWFVAETLPRSESLAREQLARQEFACFLPRFRKTRRHARRVEQALAPVFPGYIFVRFDPARDRWRAINGTRGVRRLVGPSSGMPEPMPEPAMQALLARCDGDIMVRRFSSLAVGQRVRLVAGPLCDQIASIESLDDRGRIRVLLQILGGAACARVPIDQVEPV